MSVAASTLAPIWKFTRPHAFIGTAMSIFSLWLIALAGEEFSSGSLVYLILSLLVCLSAAVFIVGINQYFDVAIDRVNKPFLPLASKELSPQQAWWLLGSTAAVAWIGMLFFNRFLIFTVTASSVLGILYSVPPTRLKRSAICAAMMIILVRGPVINLGLYGHFKSQLSSSDSITFIPIVVLLCILSSLVALCIAVCKDIPDIAGDREHGQSTFARIFGQQNSFRFVVICLALTLLGTAVSFYFIFEGWLSLILILSQFVLLGFLLLNAKQVTASAKPSITKFYMSIWNVFQIEYLVFAIAYFAAITFRSGI